MGFDTHHDSKNLLLQGKIPFCLLLIIGSPISCYEKPCLLWYTDISSKMSIGFQWMTWYYIPKDMTLDVDYKFSQYIELLSLVHILTFSFSFPLWKAPSPVIYRHILQNVNWFSTDYIVLHSQRYDSWCWLQMFTFYWVAEPSSHSDIFFFFPWLFIMLYFFLDPSSNMPLWCIIILPTDT
jgi:hypothetical protein